MVGISAPDRWCNPPPQVQMVIGWLQLEKMIGYEIEGALWKYNTNDICQTIIRLQPDESEEGLGFHIPVDRSQQNQIENINRKTKKWIDGIKASSLTRKQVYISLKTSVTNTVTYSLTVTSIDNKMMNQISVPIFTTAFPRMGIMHTLPLAFRCAASRYHGIDLPYFPAAQLIQKTEMFLMNGSQETQVGINLTICLESIQLELGVLEVLFDYPYSAYGQVSNKVERRLHQAEKDERIRWMSHGKIDLWN